MLHSISRFGFLFQVTLIVCVVVLVAPSIMHAEKPTEQVLEDSNLSTDDGNLDFLDEIGQSVDQSTLCIAFYDCGCQMTPYGGLFLLAGCQAQNPGDTCSTGNGSATCGSFTVTCADCIADPLAPGCDVLAPCPCNLRDFPEIYC